MDPVNVAAMEEDDLNSPYRRPELEPGQTTCPNCSNIVEGEHLRTITFDCIIRHVQKQELQRRKGLHHHQGGGFASSSSSSLKHHHQGQAPPSPGRPRTSSNRPVGTTRWETSQGTATVASVATNRSAEVAQVEALHDPVMFSTSHNMYQPLPPVLQRLHRATRDLYLGTVHSKAIREKSTRLCPSCYDSFVDDVEMKHQETKEAAKTLLLTQRALGLPSPQNSVYKSNPVTRAGTTLDNGSGSTADISGFVGGATINHSRLTNEKTVIDKGPAFCTRQPDRSKDMVFSSLQYDQRVSANELKAKEKWRREYVANHDGEIEWAGLPARVHVAHELKQSVAQKKHLQEQRQREKHHHHLLLEDVKDSTIGGGGGGRPSAIDWGESTVGTTTGTAAQLLFLESEGMDSGNGNYATQDFVNTNTQEKTWFDVNSFSQRLTYELWREMTEVCNYSKPVVEGIRNATANNSNKAATGGGGIANRQASLATTMNNSPVAENGVVIVGGVDNGGMPSPAIGTGNGEQTPFEPYYDEFFAEAEHDCPTNDPLFLVYQRNRLRFPLPVERHVVTEEDLEDGAGFLDSLYQEEGKELRRLDDLKQDSYFTAGVLTTKNNKQQSSHSSAQKQKAQQHQSSTAEFSSMGAPPPPSSSSSSQAALTSTEQELLLDILTRNTHGKCMNGLPIYMQISQDLFDKRSINDDAISTSLVHFIEEEYEQQKVQEKKDAEARRRALEAAEDELINTAASVDVAKAVSNDSNLETTPGQQQQQASGGATDNAADGSTKAPGTNSSITTADPTKKTTSSNSGPPRPSGAPTGGRLTKAQEREKAEAERKQKEGKGSGLIIQHSVPLQVLEEVRAAKRRRRELLEEEGLLDSGDMDPEDDDSVALDFTAEDLDEFINLHHEDEDDDEDGIMYDDEDGDVDF